MRVGSKPGNKYRNVRVAGSFHGENVNYDSKKEAEMGSTLLTLERHGKIFDLKRQVPFILTHDALTGRPIRYYADFTYVDDGKLFVADVKGLRTDLYVLKRGIMKEKYGITILEL